MRFLGWVLVLVLAACGGDDDGPAQDAAVDVPDMQDLGSCDACGADEMCVQVFDGACPTAGARCVPKTLDCPTTGSCSEECQAAYCSEPYQCHTRVACGTEVAGAFTCYGH